MKYWISVLIIFLYMNSGAKADHRSYVWTYEYQVLKAGDAELEQYTTFSTPEIDSFNTKGATELNFELEVGMTKRFDFGIYQVFKQNAGGNLRYDGFKLRWRYKFFEKNEFFVDPLIYVEYIGNPGFSEHEIETKLILAKDIGDFNISFNPFFELSYEDKEWEFVPKYAVGLSYHISELFSFGLEAQGEKAGNYIGPTISHGNERIWVALGSLFKIGNVDAGKPEFQLRLILGVGL